MATLESRQAWKEHVYGKCYACGEGHSKDDWRFQATMFEDENEGVQHLDMVSLFLKNNKSIEEDVDGNGLCCSCAQDTFDDCESQHNDEYPYGNTYEVRITPKPKINIVGRRHGS